MRKFLMGALLPLLMLPLLAAAVVILPTSEALAQSKCRVVGSQPVYVAGTLHDPACDTAGNLLTTSATESASGTSAVNSTIVALGGGAAFTGTAVDVSSLSSVTVSVFTDQASATNGLSIQQSSDGTNWDLTDTYTIPITGAGAGKTYAVQVAEKFLRVVYTNGATPQTAFRLQTILHRNAPPTSSQRPADSYTNETDMQQSWSFNSVWDATNSLWQRMKGDANGLFTQGNVASGVADAGSPVKTGCVFLTTPPAPTTGQRQDCQAGPAGEVIHATRSTGTATPTDAVANTNIVQVEGVTTAGAVSTPFQKVLGNLYDGTTNWNRQRSIVTGIDTTGAGIAAAGIIAQLDDTAPSTVTENQFGPVRLTPNRSLMVAQPVISVTTTITRPADTNAYAANDDFSDSTSAPTAGGYTLTSACAVSGGNGTIRSAVISASAATLYQGELWIFNQAATAVNDNVAFTVSDSDVQNLVAVIPFATTDITAANAVSYVTGLDYGYNCVGTANLRFLVKIMGAITPGNAEVLAVRVQVQN